MSFEERMAKAMQQARQDDSVRKKAFVRVPKPERSVQDFTSGKGLGYNASNTPSFDPMTAHQRTRGTGIVRGAAYGTGAGWTNAGGVLADTVGRVKDAFETNDYTYTQRRIAADEKALAAGRTSDGRRLTADGRKNLQSRLDRERAELAAMEAPKGTVESRQKPIFGVRDTLYRAADSMAAKGQEETAKAKEGLGKLGQLGVDVGTAGLQMVGDAPLGLAGMAIRAGGSAAQEARLNNADFNDQLGYGISSGLLSAATEKISNFAGPFKKIFGEGVVDKLAPNLVAKLGGSKAGKLALSALGEGGEEFIEAVFQPVLQRATYDPDARFNLEDALYDAAVGAVLGGVGGVSDVLSGTTPRKKPQTPTIGPVEAQTAPAAPAAGVNAPRAETAPVPPVMGPVRGETARNQVGPVDAAEHATTTPNLTRNQKAAQFAEQAEQRVQEAVENGAPPAQIQALKAIAEDARNRVGFDTAEDRAAASEHATVGADTDVGTNEANPSVGAADADFAGGYASFQAEAGSFHPINQAAAERTTEEQGRAPEEVPKVNPRTGKNIGKYASTIINAPITSNEMAEAMEQETMKGSYDQEVVTDREAMLGARNAMDRDGSYKATAQRFMQKVDDGLWLSKDDIAQAQLALDEANRAGDMVTAALLSGDLISVGTGGGRLVQALSMINRLTPGGRLLMLRRAVDRQGMKLTGKRRADNEAFKAMLKVVQRSEQSRAEAMDIIRQMIDGYRPEAGQTGAAMEDALRKSEQGRQDALNIIQTMIEEYRKKPETVGWVQALGDELTSLAASKTTTKGPRKKLISDIISGDLKTFMNQYFEKAPSMSVKRTAVDRLTDFFNNRGEYERAWEIAKQQVLEKYAITEGMDKKKAERNKAALEALKDFMSGDVEGTNNSRSVALRAVAEVAMENDVNIKNMILMDEDAAAKLEMQLISDLISKTRAITEEDQMVLTRAVTDYVYNMRRQAQSDLADALAKRAKSTVAPNEQRESTEFSRISSDLTKFMRQYLTPRKMPTAKRTAADTLRDFFNNRQEYARAWNRARENLRNQYKDDFGMLDKLEDFLGGTITYSGTGTDAVMMKAVADAAMEQDVTLKEAVIRGKYDVDNLAAEIASDVIRESGATNESDITMIVDAAKRFVANHAADSGKNADSFFDRDIRNAMHDVGIQMQDIIKQSRGGKAAAAGQITKLLTDRYHISPDGAQRIAADMTDQFQNMVNEASRKHLEALFRDTPERVQKTAQQKFEELANMGAFADPAFNEKALSKVMGTQGITIDEADAQAFLDAQTEEEREDAWEAMLDNIAKKIPATAMDKVNAWRYTAMLSALRTHGRNMLGNTAFQPMRLAKDLVGTAIESGLQAAGVDIQRTKTAKVDPALYKLAWGDFKNVEKLMGGQKYNNPKSQLEQRKPVFKTKVFERVRKGNSDLLELEDLGAKRITYTDALARFLKANGVTAQQMQEGTVDAAILDRGRAYAAEEAQKATFQDRNDFSDMVTSIGFRNPEGNKWKSAANTFLGAVQPFLRTPANVAARGAEYSPLGLAKGIYDAAFNVKNGKVSMEQAIDEISAGAAGTSIFTAGVLLAMKGILKGGAGDDDQDRFDDLQGHQEYAIELPDGTSYTLGWLSPVSIPLFMGVEAFNALAEDGFQVKDIGAIIKGMANPMMEMTMLDGINDIMDSIRYSKNKPIPAIIAAALTSYVSQFVPSFLGQLERSFEDERMTTYTTENSPFSKDTQYALGRLSAKIPGWDYHQIPYVDAWGRHESSGGPLQRAFNNMVSPGYFSKVDSTEVDQELQALVDQTGETSVFPKRVGKSFKVDGKEIDLTGEQYTKYAETAGKAKHDMVEDLIRLPEFKAMTPDEKVGIIGDVYEYANVLGKEAVSSYKPEEKWMANVGNAKQDLGMDPVEFLIAKNKYGSANFSGDAYEKLKRVYDEQIPLEDWFRFKQEAPSLDTEPYKYRGEWKEPSKTNISKKEVQMWTTQNGYGDKVGTFLNLQNKSW